MPSPAFSASTIAKLFNITERRIHQLAKEGVIPKASRGNYELIPCVQGYINSLKGKVSGVDSTNVNATERAKLTRAQTVKLELEVDAIKKTLISAKEVEDMLDDIITRCRSVLLGIPNRLAYQLASITNTQEIALLLKKAIYEALEELSTEDTDDDSNNLDDNNVDDNNENITEELNEEICSDKQNSQNNKSGNSVHYSKSKITKKQSKKNNH